jgi:hypothetical protein
MLLHSPNLLSIEMEKKQLDYDSPELKPLRKWLDAKGMKDTPITQSLSLSLYANNPSDLSLMTSLSVYTLPPFSSVSIHNLPIYGSNEVTHFLTHSLGQIKSLKINDCGLLVDGRGYLEAIQAAIGKVTKRVEVYKLSLGSLVKEILNSSLHLKYLGIYECKLRKLIFTQLHE